MRVLWTPIVESIINKECIKGGHGFTMLLALFGAILITQPTFLGFPDSHDTHYPDLNKAYLLAMIAGESAFHYADANGRID
jgi:hypothetical protein